VIVGAIIAAWALAVVAYATGSERTLHHDALIEKGPPLWAAALLFMVAWQAMTAAMMLPSSLPLIRLFRVTARRQARPAWAMAAFLGGYAAVWTVFGVAAFFGDVAIHHTVDASPWLSARPWLVGGAVLLIAGAFQFSELKDRCLAKCRQPGGYLMGHYQRGARGAFRLGLGHGLFCVGCCWALMLVMFGAGVGVLWWMAALTGLMVYEKVHWRGLSAVPVAGIVLLGAGLLQLAHPAWLGSLLAT
jgi:predicted metal-binding membrane protein